MNQSTSSYLLAGQPTELERLQLQSKVWEPAGRELLARLPRASGRKALDDDYDFGEGWEHQLLLEGVIARVPSARDPMVLAGRGACPPEDVGGLSGYYHFLHVMKDPKHPEHDDMREWVAGSFDPTVFNAYDINRAFHGGWGLDKASQTRPRHG